MKQNGRIVAFLVYMMDMEDINAQIILEINYIK